METKKLSKKDVEFCSLIRQGFSAEEITILLGLKSKRSVHVKQSRIKNKLGPRRGYLEAETTPEFVFAMLIMLIISFFMIIVFDIPTLLASFINTP